MTIADEQSTRKKPRPMADVYDWVDVKDWLRSLSPTAERELILCVEGEPGGLGRPHKRSLVGVSIDDHDAGLCGDTLSADTRALLRAELGADFFLYVWW